MPNIENLKKQAKMILRWHREGRLPVAERIRNVLPRYASLTDTEILSVPFQLRDAQELIAIENGFKNWSGIKEERATAQGSISEPREVRLAIAMPQVFVRNVTESITFYTEKLGFKVVFSFGAPAFYAIVQRDGAILNLRHLDVAPYSDAARKRDDVLCANIVVENAKGLYLEYQGSGVSFRQPLRRQPWGAHDFCVEDIDQNLLLFASRNDEP
jgi:catechol 2,3-dioxygenase-like lactoylglutathione lyase family enzyme